MYNLGCCLDQGEGVVANYPAAADWYKRAADAGFGSAAHNLSSMFTLGRGRAWQIMPATSSHSRPSSSELDRWQHVTQ